MFADLRHRPDEIFIACNFIADSLYQSTTELLLSRVSSERQRQECTMKGPNLVIIIVMTPTCHYTCVWCNRRPNYSNFVKCVQIRYIHDFWEMNIPVMIP